MRVVLVNPDSSFLVSPRVFPPLGILILGAVLKRAGHEVVVCDLAGSGEKWRNFLWFNADVYGVSAVTPQYPQSLEVMKFLRQINPESRFVVGGPHATCLPKVCLRDGWDVVTVGEGENAILKVVGSNPTSRIVQEPLIKNLDGIPFPDRSLIDIRSYKYVLDGEPATTMITSRGCPYRCAFCDVHVMWGKGVRFRSARNVLEELAMLKEEYGYRAFMFFDDTFTINPPRLRELCAGFKSLGIIFRCFARADTASEEIVRLLADSGCREIGVGVESGSQQILDIINKGTTVKQNSELVRLAHKYGVRVKAFIVVGLPGECRRTITETRKWLEENQPDDVDFSIYTPYYGSPITLNPERYDIKFQFNSLNELWYKGKPRFYRSPVSTSSLSAEEIVRYRDELERDFKRW